MPTTDPHESGNSEFQQVQNQLKKARFKEQNKKAMQNMRDQRKYGDAGKPKAEPHPETAKTVQVHTMPISRLDFDFQTDIYVSEIIILKFYDFFYS